MSWSGAEVAGVELVGGTDLGRGRGRGRRMERSYVGRRESGLVHAAQGGPRGRLRVRPGADARSVLSEQATRAGAARARRKASEQLIRGLSERERPSYMQHYRRKK